MYIFNCFEAMSQGMVEQKVNVIPSGALRVQHRLNAIGTKKPHPRSRGVVVSVS